MCYYFIIKYFNLYKKINVEKKLNKFGLKQKMRKKIGLNIMFSPIQ